ncbi:MFS transporter [Nocardia cyriacigeorgica]|uniref:MFS transporter n=1 Tax=Nocardia cyriacigeorgica TaxID=135487 RepID=UPI0018958B52|nr:MFS transporter [Nocardia cyriacigeorgica]MBF6440219.1 MFS transporter [Nocardia cyriacigeorgica]
MASYLDSAAIVSSGVALVLYQDPLHLSRGTIGALSSALTFAIAAGALVGGRLGDRYGRRTVFLATMGLLTAGAALLAAANGPGMLTAGMIMVGFAAGADLPVSLAMISEEAPTGAKGKLVGLSQVLWYIGIVVTQVLGLLVGDMGAAGARILYTHIAAVALIVLLLRLRVPESAQWVGRRFAAVDNGGVTMSVLRDLFRPPYLAPFVALTLFYSMTNLAANTKGQFGTYMYVKVAGSTVQVASAIGLAMQAVSIGLALLFMRVVDGPHRMRWYAAGVAGLLLYFGLPALAGVSVWSLAIGGLIGGIGAAFAFEGIYKVWTQEKFPTLLRATAQGATIAFARVLAAIMALWTPLLLDLGPRALFAALTVLVAAAAAIGFRIDRMPRAAEPGTTASDLAPSRA